MKHVVFFFSGTGNSLTVVKEIEKTGATAISMSAVINSQIVCNAEKVGFVFPVYYLGLPKIVNEFISKLTLSNAKYIYTVYTMGWNLRGGVLRQMKNHLAQKNLKLNMCSCIQMPMNDFTLASVHTPEQQKVILSKFSRNMEKILFRITDEKKYFSKEPIGFMVEKRNKPFCDECGASSKNFAVNDSCKGCGICAKICPVGNITLKNDKPVWNTKCQNCMACFHYCPLKAISFGGKGSKITHYHHPSVNVAELEKYHNLRI